ncbi:S1 RNA-binding domain-containing protein [soil metagenome]
MSVLGKKSILRITRETPHGVYLQAGEQGEILLPRKYVPRGAMPGSEVDVFVYRDSEDQLIATTESPFAMVGEFAVLKVTGVNRQIGAFLDWGLQKDLLLPFKEQESPVAVGQSVLVYVHLDPRSDRIFASTRLHRHLTAPPPQYVQGQPVNLIIARETPLGYIALVEGAHLGLLYHSAQTELFEPGKKVQGYIADMRPDGKIDLTLESSGQQRVMELKDQILAELKANEGRIRLDDGSSPDDIRAAFGASKKAFKQAVGALLKQKRIRFTNPGIELIQ